MTNAPEVPRHSLEDRRALERWIHRVHAPYFDNEAFGMDAGGLITLIADGLTAALSTSDVQSLSRDDWDFVRLLDSLAASARGRATGATAAEVTLVAIGFLCSLANAHDQQGFVAGDVLAPYLKDLLSSEHDRIRHLARRLRLGTAASGEIDDALQSLDELLTGRRGLSEGLPPPTGNERPLPVAPRLPPMTNPALRRIAERDLAELYEKLLPNECAKSALVLAGSVLEALLLDALTKDGTRVKSAEAAKVAPKKKGGAVRSLLLNENEDEWKLFNLIEVADELGLIRGVKQHVHDVLRQYRNLVHPSLEASKNLTVGMPEAKSACAVLEMVARELAK